ncbi:MAG: universal stress protein [Actinomycetota bacterium]
MKVSKGVTGLKVLYATDGFPAADAASRVIERLFNRALDLTVVSVTHSGSLDPGHLLVELDPIEERRKDTVEIAEAAAARLRAAGFDADTTTLEGVPGSVLVEASGNFDCIVVGAGSHSWLGNRLLGSVSTYLLHSAPTSVLVVHEARPENGQSRVVVGVDGSDTAERTASSLASLLDPARCSVEVISVVPVAASAALPMSIGTPEINELIAESEEGEGVERANAAVARAVRVFEEKGFGVTSRVERGGPAAVLLQAAHDQRADLIGVGSRGLGPIRRALLGSVSDNVARLSSAAFIGRFSSTTDETERT